MGRGQNIIGKLVSTVFIPKLKTLKCSLTGGGISRSLLMAHFLIRNIGSFVVLHWHYMRHLYTWDTLNIIVFWVSCHLFGAVVRTNRRCLHAAFPDVLNW